MTIFLPPCGAREWRSVSVAMAVTGVISPAASRGVSLGWSNEAFATWCAQPKLNYDGAQIVIMR